MQLPLKDIVRKHRRLAGLSQVELARMAGVGKTVIFDLEHGKVSIQLDTLMKILSVLNISLRYESPAMERIEKTLENQSQAKETA